MGFKGLMVLYRPFSDKQETEYIGGSEGGRASRMSFIVFPGCLRSSLASGINLARVLAKEHGAEVRISLLCQRPQNKLPFEHQEMWNDKTFHVDPFLLVMKNIKINISRTFLYELVAA